ncbi:MAG: ABC transporter permease [Kineosporiaceae bacterium]
MADTTAVRGRRAAHSSVPHVHAPHDGVRVVPAPPASPGTATLAVPVTDGAGAAVGLAVATVSPPGPWLRGRALIAAVLRRTAAVAVLLGVWEVLPRIRTGPEQYLVEPSLLPPFSQVVQAWWELLGNGQLWNNTSASLIRSAAGFGLAVAVGVPVGLLIAWYKPLREFLDPLFEVFRNTAALALLPMFTLILGIGETSKIALILYACFFPVVLNTITGVRTVDPLLVKAARSMGLGSTKLFAKVVLPASVPSIFTGIRQAGAASILVLVAAEMIGSKAGLGYLINYSQFNFMIPDMYAGIVTISVIGVAFNYALVALERRFSRWRVAQAG